MLNHPDTAVQYILTTLENQRDNLMLENGNLSARVKDLESQIGSVSDAPSETSTEPSEAPPEELPVN